MKSLKEKYGKKKCRALYNCAIRNEVAGGNKVLDLLELIYKIRKRKVGDERVILDSIHTKLEDTRAEMVTQIQRKYLLSERVLKETPSSQEGELPRFYMALDSPHINDGYYVFCRKPAMLLKMGEDKILTSVQTFGDLEGTEQDMKRTLTEVGHSLKIWLSDYLAAM